VKGGRTAVIHVADPFIRLGVGDAGDGQQKPRAVRIHDTQRPRSAAGASAPVGWSALFGVFMLRIGRKGDIRDNLLGFFPYLEEGVASDRT
jgi:hypothetical protein